MIKQLNFFLNPLYWPFWLLISLLWLLTRLPYTTQLRCGRGLGRLLHLMPGKLKATTEMNIKLCFPELSAAEQQALVKKNFENLGMGFFETAMAWWLPDKKLKPLQIKGMEHFTAAYARGKGIIMLTPHALCLEMIGRLASQEHPYTALYRPHKKPFVNYLLDRFRKHSGVSYIPTHQMRLLAKALQNNEPVWYAYDIDGGKKSSVFAPFFGIQAASLTAISRFAQLTEATVVPIHFYRKADNSGYEFVLSPPLENFPTPNLVEDATRLNSHLEQAIRAHPEQYIWQYKRFKTRPEGEKRFYAE